MIEQIQNEPIQALRSCPPPLEPSSGWEALGLQQLLGQLPSRPLVVVCPRHSPGTARIYGTCLQPSTLMEILILY